jgi:acyl-CoA dehydrogenase
MSALEAPAEALKALPGGLRERTRRAAAAAAAHAEAVDAGGRFPAEAMAALKAERLLGLQAPLRLGGEGVGVSELAEICYALGAACGSTAMIFAMHHIKLACLVRHGLEGPWLRDFVRRLARDQSLLASSTTEGQGGGDVRASEAPVEALGDRIRLKRDASVISYGAEADAVVTTARRAPDALASDQVLVVFERGDYALELIQAWDTLGMRGTASQGFVLRAEGALGQVLPTPYAVIHAETMSPVAHLLWSAVWAGVAAAAVERARLCVRKAARKAVGGTPFGLPHYLAAAAALRGLRARLNEALARFERDKDAPERLQTLEFQTSAALLKVETSELAVQAVMSALRAGGLAAYRNGGEASMGRHLRDVLSAPIMISNDRILANVGLSALLAETPTTLAGASARAEEVP